jgi:hypothetical protein
MLTSYRYAKHNGEYGNGSRKVRSRGARKQWVVGAVLPGVQKTKGEYTEEIPIENSP